MRAVARAGIGCVAVAGAMASPAVAAPLVPGPSPRGAFVAKLLTPTPAYSEPWSSKVVARVPTRAFWGGGANQLMVLDSLIVRDPARGGRERLWLRVQLPRRPNGSAGWIRADSVRLSRTPIVVRIDTRRRTIRVFRDGVLARRSAIVVGSASTPTPHGLFAINEEIRQPNPRGFLGPWALHLTAFSNVLDNFGGGPGRVGIHGRDGASLADPLGSARSHGCIRVPNALIKWLARAAVPGTPVRIRG